MFTQIPYSHTLEEGFLGRNGAFKMKGLNVSTFVHSKMVQLSPETSLGTTGRAWLNVPEEKLDDLIAALQEAKSQFPTTPAK